MIGAPVDVPVKYGRELGPERFAAEVLHHRGRTSTRNGILKAGAAIQYAEILSAADVHTLPDVACLLGDPDRLELVEHALRKVPGHGVRLSYLWMVAGDDHQVKPDRMVLRWLAQGLGRPVGVPEARSLLAAVADRLECTPWELDHAIWLTQSGRAR